MKTSFFSFSLGCRVNMAEKEKFDRELLASGLLLDAKRPNIYIINSCVVTAKAERELRQLIYKVRRELPKTKIVVTGCGTTYWLTNDLGKSLPVDLLVVNKDKEKIVELIKNGSLLRPASDRSGRIRLTDKFTLSKRYLIKIQDGCNRFCSYCIVPYLRGLSKSKKIEEVVSEINYLNAGTKEVILTAINTEAFGLDTGEKFSDLISEVIEKTRIPRISFGSIHPLSINKEFNNFYKSYKDRNRLVNFFHIPIQSGSDKILKLMKRGYTRKELAEMLSELYKINPLSLIATDIIVGFIGEDDSDFADTVDFLQKTPINKFHVFRFSPRIKTAAYYLAKKIKAPDEKTKKNRSQFLIELSKKKYLNFLRKHIGLKMTALFLDVRKDQHQKVLLENQIPIMVNSNKNLNGQIKKVTIDTIKNGQLFGKII